MQRMDALAESIKDHYCRKKFRNCARYQVFMALGRENVPIDLYPTEVDHAKEIISQAAVDETTLAGKPEAD